jgi:non-ribosomal peptide synthetase component E (peptide arylation enzyme)
MVCAVVVPRETEQPLALEEMAEYLRGRELMVQKIPERIEAVEALPRNPSGKVLKRELRKQFGSAS